MAMNLFRKKLTSTTDFDDVAGMQLVKVLEDGTDFAALFERNDEFVLLNRCHYGSDDYIEYDSNYPYDRLESNESGQQFCVSSLANTYYINDLIEFGIIDKHILADLKADYERERKKKQIENTKAMYERTIKSLPNLNDEDRAYLIKKVNSSN